MPCVNAGDRNRTYRVTVQDGPTTPQQHICKKAQIKPIYNTNRFYFINKEEKLVTSTNQQESEAHNINYIVLIIIVGTAWFRRNMAHSGKILCTYLPIQKYHIVPHLT